MPKKPHSLLRKTIVDYLRWNKWFCVPIHQSMGSYPGIPDLYCIKDGFQLWLELKVGKDKLSDYQLRFMENIQSQKGHYCIVYDLEQLQEYLNLLRGGEK
jgi:hypothetical protein